MSTLARRARPCSSGSCASWSWLRHTLSRLCSEGSRVTSRGQPIPGHALPSMHLAPDRKRTNRHGQGQRRGPIPAPTTAPIPSPTAKPMNGLSKTARPKVIPTAAPRREQIQSGLFIRPDAAAGLSRVLRRQFPNRCVEPDLSHRRLSAAPRCPACAFQAWPASHAANPADRDRKSKNPEQTGRSARKPRSGP
jgi:hypothetical protein